MIPNLIKKVYCLHTGLLHECFHKAWNYLEFYNQTSLNSIHKTYQAINVLLSLPHMPPPDQTNVSARKILAELSPSQECSTFLQNFGCTETCDVGSDCIRMLGVPSNWKSAHVISHRKC